jgi:methylenetetrahydrofolate--tRNA-(uracil-5-)-methyltransferase
MAGRMAAFERLGTSFTVPPVTTAHGALINHITGGHIAVTEGKQSSFQPMNINFGLMPEVSGYAQRGMKHTDKAIARKRAYTSRALKDFTDWLDGSRPALKAAE